VPDGIAPLLGGPAARRGPPVVGVLHLPPLPGSHRPGHGMPAVVDSALPDADALLAGRR
jgi:Predicted TIM-barrel enzyme